MLSHEAGGDSTSVAKDIGNRRLVEDKKLPKKQSSIAKEGSAKSNKLVNVQKEEKEEIKSKKNEKVCTGDKTQQSTIQEDSTSSNKPDQEQIKDIVSKKSKKNEEVSIRDDKQQSAETSSKHHVLEYESTTDLTSIDKAFVDDKNQKTSQASNEASLNRCERCRRDFDDDKKLQKHLRMHRKKDKPNKCKMCNKRFITLSSLTRHEKKYHNKTKSSESAAGLKVETKNQSSKWVMTAFEKPPLKEKKRSLTDDEVNDDDEKVATTSCGLKLSKRQQKNTLVTQISPSGKKSKFLSTMDKLNRKDTSIRAQSLSDSEKKAYTSNQNEIFSDTKKTSKTLDLNEEISQNSRIISIGENSEKSDTSEIYIEESEKEMSSSKDKMTVLDEEASMYTNKMLESKFSSHEEEIADKSMPTI